MIDDSADAVSRSLGAGEFNAAWSRGQPLAEMKVLLQPSFHNELLIVFRQSGDALAVDVVCAQQQVSSVAKGAPVPTVADSGSAKKKIEEVEIEFRRALSTPDARSMTLDGMRADVVWRLYDRRLVAEGVNVGGQNALGPFIAFAVSTAFNAIENAECKNALAHAGAYVGLGLPQSPIAPQAQKTRIVVLGDEDERADLLARIEEISLENNKSDEKKT